MKKYLTKSLHLLWVVFLLSSCAQPLLKLSPVADKFIWNDGKQVVKQETDSLKVVTSFDGELGDYLVFDTEVFNRTKRSITFNPTDFTGVMLNQQQDTIRLRNLNDAPAYYLAADPDQKLLETDLAMRKAEARLKRARVIGALLLVANVAADVATASSTKNKSDREWFRERNFFANNYNLIGASQAVSNINYQESMGRLMHEKGNWQAETMRRTTLLPGESLRGFIYIQKYKGATFLRLDYQSELSPKPVSFLFRQELLYPNRNANHNNTQPVSN